MHCNFLNTRRADRMRNVQLRLETTEKWPRERLDKWQSCRLARLVRHAQRTVPFYRDRLSFNDSDLRRPIDDESWQRIPLLTRRDLQSAGPTIVSDRIPKTHGAQFWQSTGGSTGQPVTLLGTDATTFAWRAFTLREHLWQRRDMNGCLAAIRHSSGDDASPPTGKRLANWGSATRGVIATGQGALLSIHSTTSEQVAWLRDLEPTYLLVYPSCVRAIIEHCCARGLSFPSLRQVRTFGEILEPSLRNLCEATWRVPIVDVYSSQEVGYIALQCPESQRYHVQEENVLIEILDPDGRPCRSGETGRIVVTSLHNWATPLIRYEIGDYATVGDGCSCGRGLRVLERILGRQRNMLILPDGNRRWPSLHIEGAGGERLSMPPIQQVQVIQRTLRLIEVKIVSLRKLTLAEEDWLCGCLNQELDDQFEIRIDYVKQIARSPSGKFEDFRCDVDFSETLATRNRG